MSEKTYRVVLLSDGQSCFGAGRWCVEETTIKIVASTPDEATAKYLAEVLRRQSEPPHD